MFRFSSALPNLPRRDQGAAAVEYMILLALLSVAAIFSVVGIGSVMSDAFTRSEAVVDQEMENAQNASHTTGGSSPPASPPTTGTITVGGVVMPATNVRLFSMWHTDASLFPYTFPETGYFLIDEAPIDPALQAIHSYAPGLRTAGLYGPPMALCDTITLTFSLSGSFGGNGPVMYDSIGNYTFPPSNPDHALFGGLWIETFDGPQGSVNTYATRPVLPGC